MLRVQNGERIPTVIDIFVDDVSSHYPNSGALLEERLSMFPRVKKGFKILERSSMKVSGIDGQQIAYSWTSPSFEPEVVVTREVYFDTKGLIWHLSLDSSETRAETAKADFEHMLGMFKIVD